MGKNKRHGNQSILGPEHPKIVAAFRKLFPDDLLRHPSTCSLDYYQYALTRFILPFCVTGNLYRDRNPALWLVGGREGQVYR